MWVERIPEFDKFELEQQPVEIELNRSAAGVFHAVPETANYKQAENYANVNQPRFGLPAASELCSAEISDKAGGEHAGRRVPDHAPPDAYQQGPDQLPGPHSELGDEDDLREPAVRLLCNQPRDAGRNEGELPRPPAVRNQPEPVRHKRLHTEEGKNPDIPERNGLRYPGSSGQLDHNSRNSAPGQVLQLRVLGCKVLLCYRFLTSAGVLLPQ